MHLSRPFKPLPFCAQHSSTSGASRCKLWSSGTLTRRASHLFSSTEAKQGADSTAGMQHLHEHRGSREETGEWCLRPFDVFMLEANVSCVMGGPAPAVASWVHWGCCAC